MIIPATIYRVPCCRPLKPGETLPVRTHHVVSDRVVPEPVSHEDGKKHRRKDGKKEKKKRREDKGEKDKVGRFWKHIHC